MKQTKQRDIILFKKIVRFYSYIGIFAYLERKKKLPLILFYIFGLPCFTKGCLNFIRPFDFSSIEFLLQFANILILIVFSLMCLKNAFVHVTLWKNLFGDIEEFDSVIKEEMILDEFVYKYYSKFVITNLFYFLMYSVIFLVKFDIFEIEALIGTSYAILCNIQIVVTIFSLEKLFAIIEKRYECLKRQSRRTFLIPKLGGNFCNDRNLEAAYFLLIKICKNINELFGQRIFIVLLMTFIDILASFQYSFLKDDDGTITYKSNMFRRCFRTGLYVVSIHFVSFLSFHLG